MTAAGVERAKHYVDGDVINPLLPVPLFKQHVVPELTKIFHVRDVHIRVVLLRHFAHYCRLFDTQILRSYIVPQVRACVASFLSDMSVMVNGFIHMKKSHVQMFVVLVG